ncbi:MAG TPA: response regulator transcription factor [Verrucomicrobiae bacterium]|nr:response regulator transcription factor [Verrucomicrobiae bacterium]
MISVSIVEDSASVRDSLIAIVDGTPGFRVAGAHKSGEAAVKNIPAEQPDVVLMDIHLPGMNGIECVRRLKGVLPGLHVVILTVYDDTEKIFQALEAGAIGYLLKQAAPSKILEAVIEVHGGGAPMSANIARKVVQSFQRKAVREAELTKREEQTLSFLAKGYQYKEIGELLGISKETVHVHVRHIYEKLQVNSRAQAVAKFLNVEQPPDRREGGAADARG